MKTRVALVCYLDAGHKVGAGHLVRSQAVIEQLSFDHHLYTIGHSRLVRETFSAGDHITDAGNLKTTFCRLLSEYNLVILWVDLPVVPAWIWEYEHVRLLKVVVDDYGGNHIRADIIITPNAAASWGYTGLLEWALLLSGPKFLLLRPAFKQIRRVPDSRLTQRRVGFVAGSGAAAHQWVHGLLSLDPGAYGWSQVSMVVSKYIPDYQQIKHIGQAKGITVSSDLDAAEMASFYAGCDVCAMTAGMSLYEALAVGTPVLAFPILDGMAAEVAYFEKHHAIVNLGTEGGDLEKLAETVNSLLDSPARCRKMARAGRNLVDGKGVNRISRLLTRIHADLAAGMEKQQILFSLKAVQEK